MNRLHGRRPLAILGNEGPRCRTRLYLHFVLGLPCRLVHSRGVHSVVTLCTIVVEPCNVFRPSACSLLDNVCDVIHSKISHLSDGVSRYYVCGRVG